MIGIDSFHHFASNHQSLICFTQSCSL